MAARLAAWIAAGAKISSGASMSEMVEGYARDFLQINGRWEDHVLTSLTNPAWQP